MTSQGAAAADLLEAQAAELVDQIEGIATREIGSFRRPTEELTELVRSVAQGEIGSAVDTLREPTSVLPHRIRGGYRRHGERSAECRIELTDLTRLFEIASRLVLPAAVQHLYGVAPTSNPGLGDFVVAWLQRSSAAVSLASRAYLDRREHDATERRRLREDVLSQLIAGRRPAMLAAKLIALGLPDASSYVVLAVALRPTRIDETERVIDAIEQSTPGAWCSSTGRTIVVVVPGDEPRVDHLLLAGTVADAVGGTEPVAHGQNAVRLDDLGSAINEVIGIAAAADATGRGGPVAEDEILVERLVLTAPHVTDELDALISPLTTGAGETLHALRAFLGNELSVQAAATALGIHRNTMRSRLEQIERLLGFPIEPSKLPLMLALVHRELSGEDT